MKKYLMTLLLLTSCTSMDSEITKKHSFVGYYESSFEVSSFYPYNINENWWVEGNLSKLSPNSCYKAVTMIGDVSSSGSYGHLGMYDRKFTVSDVTDFTKIDCKR